MYALLVTNLVEQIDFNLPSAMSVESLSLMRSSLLQPKSFLGDLVVNSPEGIPFDPCRCIAVKQYKFDHKRNMAVCITCRKPRRIEAITYHPFCYECGKLFTYKIYKGKEKFPFCPGCE
jgi:hypothetical protein